MALHPLSALFTVQHPVKDLKAARLIPSYTCITFSVQSNPSQISGELPGDVRLSPSWQSHKSDTNLGVYHGRPCRGWGGRGKNTARLPLAAKQSWPGQSPEVWKWKPSSTFLLAYITLTGWRYRFFHARWLGASTDQFPFRARGRYFLNTWIVYITRHFYSMRD